MLNGLQVTKAMCLDQIRKLALAQIFVMQDCFHGNSLQCEDTLFRQIANTPPCDDGCSKLNRQLLFADKLTKEEFSWRRTEESAPISLV